MEDFVFKKGPLSLSSFKNLKMHEKPIDSSIEMLMNPSEGIPKGNFFIKIKASSHKVEATGFYGTCLEGVSLPLNLCALNFRKN